MHGHAGTADNHGDAGTVPHADCIGVTGDLEERQLAVPTRSSSRRRDTTLAGQDINERKADRLVAIVLGEPAVELRARLRAWKLAAAISGWMPRDLLDSYESERQQRH
jgi:hypothetical protein